KALLRLQWTARLFDKLRPFNEEARKYFQAKNNRSRGRGCVEQMKVLQGALRMFATDRPKEQVPWISADQCQEELVKAGYLKSPTDACPLDGRLFKLSRPRPNGDWCVTCDTHATPDSPRIPTESVDPRLEESNPIIWASRQADRSGTR
ncbi:MAG: hypothetical protein HY815_28880, partial [Candidatus Riflebacteria bacterium]|nr:hypothetical protein [Candidatus Riflebacteria bacterium]